MVHGIPRAVDLFAPAQLDFYYDDDAVFSRVLGAFLGVGREIYGRPAEHEAGARGTPKVAAPASTAAACCGMPWSPDGHAETLCEYAFKDVAGGGAVVQGHFPTEGECTWGESREEAPRETPYPDPMRRVPRRPPHVPTWIRRVLDFLGRAPDSLVGGGSLQHKDDRAVLLDGKDDLALERRLVDASLCTIHLLLHLPSCRVKWRRVAGVSTAADEPELIRPARGVPRGRRSVLEVEFVEAGGRS